MDTVTVEQRAAFAALTAEQRTEIIDALSAAVRQVNHPGSAFIARAVKQLRSAPAAGRRSSLTR